MHVKYIIAAGIYLISLLPYRVIYLLSDLLYYLIYYVIRYRREVVRTNLSNAFPEKSGTERTAIEQKFYRFLADLIVESIKMRTMSLAQINKRMVVKNPEVIKDYMEAGRPVIGVAGHYANWEFAIYGVSILTSHPFFVVYKPLSNKSFETVYNKIRSRFGAILVPMKLILRQIIQYRNTPHLSIFVTDQTPVRQENNSHYIPFLNQPTLVFLGAEKMARMTNFPVVYFHIDRVKRGHYTCTFTTLTDAPAELPAYEITRLHSRFLEDIIQQKPELWLWSHRRWKHSPQ